MAGGVANGERTLLFGFEESREQLFRNATGWGIDFKQMEKSGKLRVVCLYPEVQGLEDHLIAMKEAIDEFKPNRIAVDSLSALERVSTVKGFREFMIDAEGMHIGKAFRNVAGILAGNPTHFQS